MKLLEKRDKDQKPIMLVNRTPDQINDFIFNVRTHYLRNMDAFVIPFTVDNNVTAFNRRHLRADLHESQLKQLNNLLSSFQSILEIIGEFFPSVPSSNLWVKAQDPYRASRAKVEKMRDDINEYLKEMLDILAKNIKPK